jgi:protoporphyrinogen oxidase
MVVSYLAAGLRRGLAPRPIATFEDWVVDRFGDRLFRTFFKSYTEKIWGIDCRRIAAEWAGQRIKGLSLTAAVRDALMKSRRGRPRTLADEFLYPRLGAGQLYEKMAERIAAGGGTIRLDTECRAVRRQGFRVTGVEIRRVDGVTETIGGDHFLVSAPLTELLAQLDPAPPSEVQKAAVGLRYRHHIGVQLTLAGRSPFPDNWIYIHEPAVRMARVSSYRNFSAAMGRGGDCHPLTVEYFCFAEDAIWTAPDVELVALAKRELAATGLADPSAVVDGFVIRSRCAYPVIEIGVGERLEVIKRWLDRFENLLPIGRSGMFKYNNQDHAMATGIMAARTALGLGRFDPWQVNIDGVYQEGGPAPSTSRSAPAKACGSTSTPSRS